uniref:Uncharacterized protein n=1 Tax=Oryza meridionalis TaxID=40149 RepID=A0A0E0CYS1_9ORYZ
MDWVLAHLAAGRSSPCTSSLSRRRVRLDGLRRSRMSEKGLTGGVHVVFHAGTPRR